MSLFILVVSEDVFLYLFPSPPREGSSYSLRDTLGSYFIQSCINNETVSNHLNTKLDRDFFWLTDGDDMILKTAKPYFLSTPGYPGITCWIQSWLEFV